MKIYNVIIEHWSEAHGEYVEFQRQYIGENEEEAIKEAETDNPGDAVLYASEIGEEVWGDSIKPVRNKL